MARSVFRETIIDASTGNAVAGATVYVRDVDTTSSISATIYADKTGGSTLSNPLTSDSNGMIQFYLDTGQAFDLRVSAAGLTAFTVPDCVTQHSPTDVVTLTGSQTLTNKTLSSASLSSPTISGGTWSGGTFSSPTFSGSVSMSTASFSGTITGATSGKAFSSLANPLTVDPLGDAGNEDDYGIIGIQRGTTGEGSASVVPVENWQIYVQPNDPTAGNRTGYTWYRRVHRVGDVGDLAALYANFTHLIANSDVTVYGGGTDNAGLAVIAENTAAKHARIWGVYAEVRAYSATAASSSAVAGEFFGSNGMGAAAGEPWASGGAQRLAGAQWVCDATILGVSGSKYGTMAAYLASANAGQRDSWRVGVYYGPQSIRKSGSDASLAIGSTEDLGGYAMHMAALDPTTRANLMAPGQAVWAAVDGWTSASAYGTDRPLIGTEVGVAYTYVYASSRFVVAPAQASSTPYFRASATDFTVPPAASMGFASSTALTTPDTYFSRDGAAAMGLRDGTTAQRISVYNTYSSGGTNYERLGAFWSSNILHLLTENGGTGSARALRLGTGGADQWDISTGGVLSTLVSRRAQSKQPAVRVYKDADATISTGFEQAITFNQERYDQDGNGSAAELHTSTSGSMVAPIAGKYLITCNIEWEANATGSRQLRCYANGATVIADDLRAGVATLGIRQSISTVYHLAASDTVSFTVLQSSGGDLKVKASGNYSPEATMTYLSD